MSEPKSFSIEACIVGRNDEYEPNWERNLFAMLDYNRRLFEGTGIDYRAVFVEWNPLPSRPLLAPRLVESLPFVRGIVVDSAIHAQLCTSADLPMVLTIAFNAGFRTTSADFSLGTCGDILLSTTLVERICREGLRRRCFYRAERANIRNDLDFPSATPQTIEKPENVLSVDTCSEPPYDKPPFTNSGGDFSMTDSGTMTGIRGYDEGITFARMHIDARLGWTAMNVVEDCLLLGRIFHISHAHSHTADIGKKVPGKIYNYTAGLPYLNPTSWGLGDFDWRPAGERLYRVAQPNGSANPPPENLSEHARETAVAAAARLREIRSSSQPDSPTGETRTEFDLLALELGGSPDWGSTVWRSEDGIGVQTSPHQWGWGCMIKLPSRLNMEQGNYYWIKMKLCVDRGAVGLALAKGANFLGERYVTSEEGPTEAFVPVSDPDSQFLLIRNLAESGSPSVAWVYAGQLVSQPKG